MEDRIQGRDRSRTYDVGPVQHCGCGLHARAMDYGGRSGNTLSFAQECGLFHIALHEMDLGSGIARKRACDDESREPGAGAHIDPEARTWREVNELQRIGDVPRPEVRNGRRRDQMCSLLPSQKESDEAVEFFRCFT